MSGSQGEGFLYIKPVLAWRLALIISAVFLLLYYGVFLYFDYPSAPGGDLYNHFLHLQELRQFGLSHIYQGYPKLFHLIAWAVMSLTGWSLLKAALFLIPLVLLASAWAAAWVSKLFFGRWAAVLTIFILLFVSAQPVQTLYDGGFPNLIAAHIWLPLMVGSLYCASSKKSVYWFSASLIIFILITLTHAFTTVYAGFVLFAAALYYWRRYPHYWLVLIAIMVAFWISPYSEAAKSMLSSVCTFKSVFPWISLVGKLENQNAIWKLADYPVGISYLVAWGAVLSLPLLFWEFIARRSKAFLAYLVLFWLIMVFIGSQTPSLVFPVRLARDLATPAVIACTVALVAIWRRLRAKPLLQALLGLVVLVLAYPHAMDRFTRLFKYEPLISYTHADQLAVIWIGDTPAASLDQYLPYVVRQNVRPVELDVAKRNNLEEQRYMNNVNREKLGNAKYVFYEVYSGHNGEVYREFLEYLKFKEIAVFKDPLKKVFLFQRY